MENIYSLHADLKSGKYCHGTYTAFKINDPKPRDIHKAEIRDRLMHHAIYRILYPYFDRKFIYDSYSCRLDKSTHRAMNRFRDFARTVSQNDTRSCFVLKCDIRKFFASIDHAVMKTILMKSINDEKTLSLLGNIIDSFQTKGKIAKGFPLGNLTSQLMVNVYMNVFDQFVKHQLKVKYYIRYADDFAVLSHDKNYLISLVPIFSNFLREKLKLSLHPDKVFIKRISTGVDFLGWIHFSSHRVLRTTTKHRMFRNLRNHPLEQAAISYLGMLSHGNGFKLQKKIGAIIIP